MFGIDPAFELFNSINIGKMVKSADKFLKDETTFRQFSEIHKDSNNTFIIQKVITSMTVTQLKFGSDAFRNCWTQKIILISSKVLQEPLLFAVGWFLSPNPENIFRQKFMDDVQETLNKIVAEKFDEMFWSKNIKDETEGKKESKKKE